MLPKRKTRILALAATLWLLVGAPGATPGVRPKSPPTTLCTLKPGQTSLAPGARHGLARHLRQYPDLSLATPQQRRAAERLLSRSKAASHRWRAVTAAAARGFNTHLAKRAPGDTQVGYLHAEHRRYSADRFVLDPRRPESLIYATEPGLRPRLIGVMFSVGRGVRGPTPGGAIDRWHSHAVCVRGSKRGLTPPPDGRCPAGATLTQGSEMLHLWFTNDLRSAYAVHAPVPELCRDGLLSRKACSAGGVRGGM